MTSNTVVNKDVRRQETTVAYDMNLTDEGGTSPAFEREDGTVHSTPTSSSDPGEPDAGDVVHICKTCMTARPDESSSCGECGEPLVPIRSVQDSYIGETVGDKYKLVEQIGSGGMGDVYLGINEPLDQRVAVKFLSQKYSANEQVIMRFLNEARSYCRVNHPNAVTLLDYGQHDDGALYIITEYVEGISLTDAITEHGPLEPEKALSVTRQCCEVLEAAHGEGVIHRDLKPDNIMLMPASRGRYAVKVLDFGIAKIIDDERGLTKTGSVFGTPEFMSPEQAKGEVADPRSDLYALGIILFYTSTGKLPFEAESQFKVLEQQTNEAPPKASSVVEGDRVPSSIERIIECSLSKERDDRFDDAEQMLEAIGEARRRVAGTDSSPTLGERAGRTDGGQRTIELTDIVDEEGGPATRGYPAGGESIDGRADTPLAADIDDLDPDIDIDISADLDDLDLGEERRREPFQLSNSSRDSRPIIGAVAALVLTAGIVGWQVWSTSDGNSSAGTSGAGAVAVDDGGPEADREARRKLSAVHSWLDEATVARAERTLDEFDKENVGTADLETLLSVTKKRLEDVSSTRSAFVDAIDGDCDRAARLGRELTALSPEVSDWVDRRVERCHREHDDSAPAADGDGASAQESAPASEKPESSDDTPESSATATTASAPSAETSPAASDGVDDAPAETTSDNSDETPPATADTDDDVGESPESAPSASEREDEPANASPESTDTRETAEETSSPSNEDDSSATTETSDPEPSGNSHESSESSGDEDETALPPKEL